MTDPLVPMPMRHPAPTPEEMRSRRRVIIARNIFIALGVLLVAVTLGVVTYSVVVIRQAQVGNGSTLDAVRSCTTPGRECYDRGRRQTAGAVADINRVVILAAACSVGLDRNMRVAERQAVIQACVIDRLAQQPR